MHFEPITKEEFLALAKKDCLYLVAGGNMSEGSFLEMGHNPQRVSLRVESTAPYNYPDLRQGLARDAKFFRLVEN